jgi:hypothetical protein
MDDCNIITIGSPYFVNDPITAHENLPQVFTFKFGDNPAQKGKEL